MSFHKFLEVGVTISLLLCGYVCWLTPNFLSESTYYLPTILTKFTSQAAPMSCKCRGNMRSIISTGHFSNAWAMAFVEHPEFKGMDFLHCEHRVTTMQYCFEDHLVHSVKFSWKFSLFFGLIITHDPDDNWPLNLAGTFPSAILVGKWFSQPSPKGKPQPLDSRLRHHGVVGVVQTFEDSEAFWNPHGFLEPESTHGKKRLLQKVTRYGRKTNFKHFWEQSPSVCKRGKNVHPIEMISSEPFCQFERLYIMISAECTVQRVERMVVRTVRIYDSIYYDMSVLRLLVIDMSFLSTSFRSTYHQLVR